jgi:hypothetical protein
MVWHLFLGTPSPEPRGSIWAFYFGAWCSLTIAEPARKEHQVVLLQLPAERNDCESFSTVVSREAAASTVRS